MKFLSMTSPYEHKLDAMQMFFFFFKVLASVLLRLIFFTRNNNRCMTLYSSFVKYYFITNLECLILVLKNHLFEECKPWEKKNSVEL